MSHVLCPICAKYSYGSTFNPENLDDDIYLVNFKGKGRGKGFEAYDHQSIMGDDVYTPLFVKRILQMLKTFITTDIIKIQDVLKELSITPTYVRSREIPRSNILDRNEIALLKEELSKKEKEINSLVQAHKTLDDVLGNIFFYSDYVVRFNDLGVWYILINRLAPESYNKLLMTFGYANPRLKDVLNRKIKGGNLEVNILLDFIRNQPKRKTVLEKLLEFPLS